jgi:hypothetical protein
MKPFISDEEFHKMKAKQSIKNAIELLNGKKIGP